MARACGASKAWPSTQGGGPRRRHARRIVRRRTYGFASTASLGVLCMVLLVLVGRVAFAAHMLLVPHHISAHGLVHNAHEHAPAATDVAAVQRDAPLAEASNGDATEPEYCQVLALKEAPPETVCLRMPPHILVWQLIGEQHPATVEVAQLPVLMLAPKQSPPRA